MKSILFSVLALVCIAGCTSASPAPVVPTAVPTPTVPPNAGAAVTVNDPRELSAHRGQNVQFVGRILAAEQLGDATYLTFEAQLPTPPWDSIKVADIPPDIRVPISLVVRPQVPVSSVALRQCLRVWGVVGDQHPSTGDLSIAVYRTQPVSGEVPAVGRCHPV